MKDEMIMIIIIIIFILSGIFSYLLIKEIDYKTALSNIEKYTIKGNEKILDKLTYNKKEYIITKIQNKETINILFKYHKQYYRLKKISSCLCNDIFIKDNEMYLHCIGLDDYIEKYIINNLYIEHERIRIFYDQVPNLSEYLVKVEKVDDKYIYIKSTAYNILEPDKARCSLTTRECEYYN